MIFRVASSIIIVFGISFSWRAQANSSSIIVPPPTNAMPEPVGRRSISLPTPVVAKRSVFLSGSITDADYPTTAWQENLEGSSFAKITIGRDGGVESCDANGAVARLNSETCKLIIRRYIYLPALDKDGLTVRDTRSLNIKWIRPNIIPNQVDININVGSNGKFESCYIVSYHRDIVLEKKYCSMFKSKIYKPAHNWKNEPILSTRKIQVKY